MVSLQQRVLSYHTTVDHKEKAFVLAQLLTRRQLLTAMPTANGTKMNVTLRVVRIQRQVIMSLMIIGHLP